MQNTFRLNLEQQKKQAKELLKGFQVGASDAVSRFQTSHPKFVHKEHNMERFTPKISDAQLVISRELGCKTWSQLKHHILLMQSLKGQVDTKTNVLDEPENSLHIRCGSDIEKSLVKAGFGGDFLEFSDPFCVGPVSYDYKIEERAHFLYKSYGKSSGQSYDQVYTKLKRAYQTLRMSPSDYEHVILWFEHDPYDQFILVFLLSRYFRLGLPKNLWLVTTNQFPGTVKFRGMGQLPSEGLRLLWQSKQLLTVQHCEEASKHWSAFTQPNKERFHKYVQSLSGCLLPYFKTASLRQILEQPSKKSELSLTKKLTIEILTDNSPMSAGLLFQQIMEKKDPLPFLGDIMYWNILIQMEEAGLICFLNEKEQWNQTLVGLP